MDTDSIFIKSFSIGGYRSFSDQIQHFQSLAKVNLFIGQNNCGKSNILRFICNIYPNFSKNPPLKFDQLDRPLPVNVPFSVGALLSLDAGIDKKYSKFNTAVSSSLNNNPLFISQILRVCQKKAELDKTDDVWFYLDENFRLIQKNWEKAFIISELDDREIYSIWQGFNPNITGGDRNKDWIPDTINHIRPHFNSINAIMIPAIRSIGKKDSTSDNFSGDGIIERVVKLQNPDVHNRHDRKKFDNINTFLQSVTDNKTAEIEIPHERDTILVHMDGKTLPLSNLGTGIHEVIILAAASTILENTVICMEEPEIHLHPFLQKKLIRYFLTHTKNQYFISTHSAALLDTPNAEIYHIHLINGQSVVDRVTSDAKKSIICEDLGYHPSDLLQSNCIIWVEGPSDRIYLNYWINCCSPVLVEGIHYSIMFYGGRLLSHLSGEDISDIMDDFISLRRLNRRGMIVIDSDKEDQNSEINATKKRLKNEFDKGPGYAWITQGREIENYIAPDQLKKAIEATKPSATPVSSFGQFDNTLSIKTKQGGNSQASKVDVARFIVEKHKADLSILDLKKCIDKLVEFIIDSNPGVHQK